MSEQKVSPARKTISIILMVIHAIVILGCAASCVFTVVTGTNSGGQQLPAVFCFAALVMTAWYALKGYKKDDAFAFKLVLLFCSAASLVCLVPHMYNLDAINGRPIGAILCALGYAICFGLYLILAFVPDLGKVKSFCIITFIALVFTAVLLSSIILRPGMLAGGTKFDSMRIFRHACMVELALNVVICYYFKYRDKKARGTN